IGFGLCNRNSRMLFHGFIVFFLSQIYFRSSTGSTQFFVEMPILLTNCTSDGFLARGMFKLIMATPNLVLVLQRFHFSY
ncbi:MAG: hypothetical protein WB053_07265, partial [Nitrososphaeraceae archaeon]